jgi:flagellar FliJ protein
MNKSKRLERVNELRKDQERSAGRELAEAQQDRAGKEQLLDQLLGYQREYQALFAQQSAQGLDVQQYRNFQKFFLQLDAAVAEQQIALQQGDTKVSLSRDQWLEKRIKTETLTKLRSGLQRKEAHAEQKLEQKQSDDRFMDSKRNGHT